MTSITTTALVLWLTCIGCLACCLSMPAAAMAAAPEPTVSKSSCCTPSACHQSAPAEGYSSAPVSKMPFCPILAAAPGPMDVQRPSDIVAAPPMDVFRIAPPSRAPVRAVRTPEVYVADRGDTHLRCCVFLI